MDVVPKTASTGEFAFSSSVTADVWHPQKDPKAYEWWYFDALGHGGAEAIVIVFLDNFIYSPRYNRDAADNRRFPAVSFTYFADGKPLYRCVTEFDESDFSAKRDMPECRKVIRRSSSRRPSMDPVIPFRSMRPSPVSGDLRRISSGCRSSRIFLHNSSVTRRRLTVGTWSRLDLM